MPAAVPDLRSFLLSHETISVQELEAKLTCPTPKLLSILKAILNRNQFSATERLYSRTLLKHYDRFKEFQPKSQEEAQEVKEKAKSRNSTSRKKGETQAQA